MEGNRNIARGGGARGRVHGGQEFVLIVCCFVHMCDTIHISYLTHMNE